MSEIERFLRRYAKAGLMTHAAAGVGRLGSGLQFACLHSPDGKDVFDLASMTKALATTPLVFASGVDLKAGLHQLSQDPGLPQWVLDLPIERLLRHETGLPAWRNFYVNVLGPGPRAITREERHELIRVVINRSLNNPVISRHPPFPETYSDLGFILLGKALEDYYGKNLASIFAAFAGSAACLTYGRQGAISTGWCACRERELSGEVWDENAAALGGECGHAGLFGSLRDVADWLETLATIPAGRQVIASNRAALHPSADSLMGWRRGGDPSSDVFGGGHAIGHMGFTGTAFWLRDDDTYAILLTNRVISRRIDRRIVDLRREVFDLLDKI